MGLTCHCVCVRERQRAVLPQQPHVEVLLLTPALKGFRVELKGSTYLRMIIMLMLNRLNLSEACDPFLYPRCFVHVKYQDRLRNNTGVNADLKQLQSLKRSLTH